MSRRPVQPQASIIHRDNEAEAEIGVGVGVGRHQGRSRGRLGDGSLSQGLLLATFVVAGLTAMTPVLLAVDAGDALGTTEAGLRSAWLTRYVLALAAAIPIALLGAVRSRWTGLAITGAWWIVCGAAAAALVNGSGVFGTLWALIGIGDAMVGVAGFAALGLFSTNRFRRAATVRGGLSLGAGIGALAATLAPDWLELSWRGVMILLATATLPILVSVLTISAAPSAPPGDPARDTAYSSTELLAAVTNDRRAQPHLLIVGASSALITAMVLWARSLLTERFAIVPSTIALTFGLSLLVAGVALVLPIHRKAGDIAGVLGITGLFAAVSVRGGTVAVIGIAGALTGLTIVLGLAEDDAVCGFDNITRSMAGALVVVSGATGSLCAVLLGGSIDRRFGTAVAIATVGGFGGFTLLVARLSVKERDRPIPDTNIEGVASALAAVTPRTEKLPTAALLNVEHVDLSYGQVQVLFDVSLSVGHGELVALLGTNGAGKSTLLKVISGQVLPQLGSVHFGGIDVTSIGAQRRVLLGLSQVAGGRAVFGPLTVAENLDLFSVTAGDDPADRRLAIDRAYDTFPILRDRRNQSAQTLSGGQQQMLALAKAVMASPRMLCIDELSLGLAPTVVGELLDILRAINTAGTAVVLVEQSLNVALSIADRAVFMEKGEIRFDGPSETLRSRDDLLRSVFFDAEPVR